MNTQWMMRMMLFVVASLTSVGCVAVDTAWAPSREMDDPGRLVYGVFDDTLGREPTRWELHRYADLILDEGWTVRDVERDIRERNRESSGSYLSPTDARRWVDYAFEDELGRIPSHEERDRYLRMVREDRISRKDMRYRIRQDFAGSRDESRKGGRSRGRERSRVEPTGGYGRVEPDRWDQGREPKPSDAVLVEEKVRWVSSAEVEKIIRQAYLDLLFREPDDNGLRNYRRLMLDEGWSEKRVRENIANSLEATRGDLNRIITRAYEDLLDRAPRESEINHYIEVMRAQRWDERKLRDMIREGREYQYDRPHQMITKAYNEVLLREPEGTAFEGLRREIVRNGWNLERVKKHLRDSPEYRTQTIPEMIRRAYKDVLGREPDAPGLENYRKQMLQGMTFETLLSRLKDSEEYRNRKKNGH